MTEVDESLVLTARGCSCTALWPCLYPGLRTKSALRATATSSMEFVALPMGSGEVVIAVYPNACQNQLSPLRAV